MAVLDFGGKEAITHYRLLEKFPQHSHIRLKLETGRTHQIRVHMAHIKYPLVGDVTYAGRLKLPRGGADVMIRFLKEFKRQALHAAQLGLFHPATGDYCEWSVPLPEDMQQLIAHLADLDNYDD